MFIIFYDIQNISKDRYLKYKAKYLILKNKYSDLKD